ncbi:MAG TPA: nitronate monooxygenase [Burkholderiales bacterium]|jgi:nitronate monooxygenase|nr:nitronate monooxygenase [Burkholderiales bacterium]
MMLATPLSEKFGISVPIVQAPMAGGPSSPELVAACSAAGALGAFGFAYTQPEEMKKQCAWVRARTDKPFGINLFTSAQPGPVDAASQRGALEAVAGYYKELGLPVPDAVKAPYAPDLEAQFDAIAAIKPKVVTCHLADFPKARVKQFKGLGILVGGSANCVAEAKHLESLGFDFVIAQGGEAGGHRGSYLRDPYTSLTGTLALVRMIVRAVNVPVVAAGGIMDGAGIAAVLSLGAQVAQLGTAFLPCPESGASQVHKDILLKVTEDETRITEKFSGKPARGLANRFMKEMEKAPQLVFPAQNNITGKLRQASAKAGKPDFMALWAGQAAPLCRALPAAELIRLLNEEAVSAVRGTASFLKD